MTLTIIIIYLALVLFVGSVSNRLFRRTGEDYFVASRTIGPFFLLMSLFGTNMTAFAILGGSREAYKHGIGVFALMPAISAIVIPAVFFFVGTRVWALGKKHGYLTQIEFVRDRWGSDIVGLLLFVVVVLLLIPYLLIGVMGGGGALNWITDKQVPPWVGGALVTAVVFAYVCFGGLRGTAWANAFQTLVFMILGGVTVYVIVSKMGGLQAALDKVNEKYLVREGNFKPLHLLTYTFIPLSVGMFPHMFMHWLTAEKASTFKRPLMLYPICIAAVWVPSVLLGVLGTVDFEGLGPKEVNYVLIGMINMYAPGVLAGLLCAGVFAAIMSSLDSQALSIGSMFTNDIVKHYRFKNEISDKQQVLIGRIFLGIVLGATFILAQFANQKSIFGLGIWCFSGFAALFPVVIAALFWKRSTKWGALASVATVIASWLILFFYGGGEGVGGEYTFLDSGVMPVTAMFAASALAMIVVSLLTQPPGEERLARFFPAGKE